MAYERPAGWAVHPGKILKDEFLKPLRLSEYALAKSLGVHAQAVNDICLRKRGISAEKAILLGRFFSTTPEFWMNLQSVYELALARKGTKRKLAKVKPYTKSA